jgi:hypothetical protein
MRTAGVVAVAVCAFVAALAAGYALGRDQASRTRTVVVRTVPYDNPFLR